MMDCRSLALSTVIGVFLAVPAMAQDTVQVQVAGAVRTPGAFQIPAGGRLSDAVLAAAPAADAYLPGAMFLRERQRLAQVRLRAGLGHDLAQLQRSDEPAVAEAAGRLAAWLDGHPAIGRVAQPIDARLMQVQPQSNPVLEPADTLVVPTRPATVRVMGAVLAECQLQHAPLDDAPRYLQQCPASAAADPDAIYVIQPDGQVQRLGAALWNRADPQAVAPGGTVYVPVRTSSMPAVDENFNAEFAAFIATQPATP